MLALKLPTLASAFPHKWMRAITTTTTTSTIVATASATTLSTPKFSVGFSRRVPAGWRTTASAPLSFPAHIPYRQLGFRSQKIFFSSEDRGGVGLGGIVTDMGSENKCDHWPPEEKTLAAHKPCHQRQHPSPLPPEQYQQHSAKLLTLPTILTIGRVASVPVLIGTFYVDSWWGATITTSIFIAAAITDWLDGYIARKLRLSSAFGAFLDPVADKLMVAATLVLLCTRPLEVPMLGQVSWLLTVPVIVIISREITMSAVREWAASQGTKVSEAVAVNNLGKWKTATQMTALTILLASRDSSLTETGTLVASGVVLLYISAGLAVWSLVVYMRKIWKVLLK